MYDIYLKKWRPQGFCGLDGSGLGLIEIKKDASSERILQCIKERLQEYGIKNFSTITADGAKVNQKIARLTGNFLN